MDYKRLWFGFLRPQTTEPRRLLHLHVEAQQGPTEVALQLKLVCLNGGGHVTEMCYLCLKKNHIYTVTIYRRTVVNIKWSHYVLFHEIPSSWGSFSWDVFWGLTAPLFPTPLNKTRKQHSPFWAFPSTLERCCSSWMCMFLSSSEERRFWEQSNQSIDPTLALHVVGERVGFFCTGRWSVDWLLRAKTTLLVYKNFKCWKPQPPHWCLKIASVRIPDSCSLKMLCHGHKKRPFTLDMFASGKKACRPNVIPARSVKMTTFTVSKDLGHRTCWSFR